MGANDNHDIVLYTAMNVATIFMSRFGAKAFGDTDDVKQTAVLITIKLFNKGLRSKTLASSVYFGLIDEARKLGHFRTSVKMLSFDSTEIDSSDPIFKKTSNDIQKEIDSRDHVSTIENALSTKELQITSLIKCGYSQKEIAKILQVNRSTITRRLQRIRRKIILQIDSKEDKKESS